ncbi:uncharacterized protein PgNI_02488 [Pyricularia grisea]|uniref:Uncharacterized protein n=1 Tax=Pyricularia grisea TaxID=148305 RepID=A0A6P8BJU1_PYRGI|nr:uncharacterized protein PgNI_02488 [Pyricularia grisea]TLD17161.1 hypothetical protein PgNI_02488 [Pyricularia grisea]
MSQDNQAPGGLFFYVPNTGAAAFFTAAYAMLCLLHTWQAQRYRSWAFTGWLVFSALLFTSGFAVRIFCSFNYRHANAFIASQFIIYTTAPILELANFHLLGRILYFIPYLSPIHPGRVLSTFLFCSCIVEILNALGVMQSIVGTVIENSRTPEKAADYVAQGHALMKASLILQLSFAVIFVCLAGSVHQRCLKRGIRNRKVTIPLATLYTSMGFITARTVFRTVEHFAFEDLTGSVSEAGWLAHYPPPVVLYEWYFYVFEATFMFLAIAVFNLFHPGQFLPSNNKIYLAQDGQTEIEGPGWSDRRQFLMTLCDPFNLAGCFDRKAGVGGSNFWEDNGFAFPADANKNLGSQPCVAILDSPRTFHARSLRPFKLNVAQELVNHGVTKSWPRRVGALLQWPTLKEEFSSISRAVVGDHAGVIDTLTPEFHVVLTLLLPGLAVKSGMVLPTLQQLFEKAVQVNTCKSSIDGNAGHHIEATTLHLYGLDVSLERAKEPTENADVNAVYARSILRLLLRIRRKNDYKHMAHWVRDADLFTQVWVFFCTLAFMQFEDLQTAYERLSLGEKARLKIAGLLRKDS